MEATFTRLLETWSEDDIKERPEIITRWWQQIHDSYSEPQRYYHTLTHIESMLNGLETMQLDGESIETIDLDAIKFSIFFHECVSILDYKLHSHLFKYRIRSISTT